MTPSLTDLIARVERAEGPDRELDRDLGYALDYRPDAGAWEPAQDGWALRGTWRAPLPVTASLDAALALVEAVLPGALYEIKALPARLGHGASLWSVDPAAGRMLARADHRAPALALVLALLRAVAEQAS